MSEFEYTITQEAGAIVVDLQLKNSQAMKMVDRITETRAAESRIQLATFTDNAEIAVNGRSGEINMRFTRLREDQIVQGLNSAFSSSPITLSAAPTDQQKPR